MRAPASKVNVKVKVSVKVIVIVKVIVKVIVSVKVIVKKNTSHLHRLDYFYNFVVSIENPALSSKHYKSNNNT